jgi:hypothetical protein
VNKRNGIVLVGSILILVGFFLAWIGLSTGGLACSITGWAFARVARQHGALYYLIYLLPLGALVAAYLSIKNRVAAAKLGVLVGGAFLSWAVIEVLRILWHTTFIGLWLSLAGATVLLFGGLATLRK